VFTRTATWTPTVTFTPTISDTPTITLSPTITLTPPPDPPASESLYLDRNFFNPRQQPLGMDCNVGTGGQVKITVFNLAGEKVITLENEYESAGLYRMAWDGRNNRGETVGNGVYFVILQQPSGTAVRKVIVLK
jgi:hypothetical protein